MSGRARPPGWVVLTALALVAAPAASAAQLVAGGTSQSFSFSDTPTNGLRDASLQLYRFGAGAALPGGLRLDVAGGLGSASITARDGSTLEMSGVTDTEVRVVGRLMSFDVVAFGQLPTGDPTLTVEEAAVVGTLAQDLLPFPIATFGRGGRYGAEVTTGSRVGSFTLSGGFGFTVSSAVRLLEDSPVEYAPGATTSGSLRLSRQFGGAHIVAVTYRAHALEDDAWNDAPALVIGGRTEATLSYAFPLGAQESAALFVSAFDREPSVVQAIDVLTGTNISGPVAVGRRVEGSVSSPARLLVVGGGRLRVRRGDTVIRSELEVRGFRRDDGVGQGWLGSIGIGADRLIMGSAYGGGLVLGPWVGISTGRTFVRQGETVSVRGLRFTLNGSWAWPD